MADLPESVSEALDEIDAAIFSGDTFRSAEALSQLDHFLGRWQRAADTIRNDLYLEELGIGDEEDE